MCAGHEDEEPACRTLCLHPICHQRVYGGNEVRLHVSWSCHVIMSCHVMSRRIMYCVWCGVVWRCVCGVVWCRVFDVSCIMHVRTCPCASWNLVRSIKSVHVPSIAVSPIRRNRSGSKHARHSTRVHACEPIVQAATLARATRSMHAYHPPLCG